jgi:predicted HAD superfamily Cof-like phosphohydrolase
MNKHTSEAPMAITKKVEKTRRKITYEELTFLDVRQAARDGQKVFDKFVTTGKLSITKWA